MMTTEEILIISDVIYPRDKGGVEKRISSLFEATSKSYNIAYITSRGIEPNTTIFESDAVTGYKWKKVIEIGRFTDDFYNSVGERGLFNALTFSIALFLYLLIRRPRPKLMFVNASPWLHIFVVLLYSFLMKVPYIIDVSEIWSLNQWKRYRPGLVGIIGFVIQQMALDFSPNIAICSDRLRKKLPANKNVLLLRNSINLERIRQIRKESYSSGSIHMGTLGRFVREKQHEMIFEVASKLDLPTDRKLIFHIAGSGPLQNDLKRTVDDFNHVHQSSNKRMIFHTDLLTHDQVLSYLKELDVFLQFSKREGFGLVIIEALSLGIKIYPLSIHPIPEPYTLIKTYQTLEELIQSLNDEIDEIKGLRQHINSLEVYNEIAVSTYFLRFLENHYLT